MKKLWAILQMLVNFFTGTRIFLYLLGYWPWQDAFDKFIFSLLIGVAVLWVVLDETLAHLKVIMK